jgi:hypothetical protein
VSCPDLFHLSLCLSPSPPDVAHHPRCIYPCVFCLSVPVHLVCQVNQRLSPSFYFSQSLFFLVLLVLTLACPDTEPTCLTILPALTSSLPNALYCLDSDLISELSPVPNLPFAYPLCYNKYRSLTICLMCLNMGLVLCPYRPTPICIPP